MMHTLLRWMFFTVLLYVLTNICGVTSQEVSCPVNGTWGSLDGGDTCEAVPDDDVSFIIADNHTTCYGKITKWDFTEGSLGTCHDIVFQVYRPTNSGGYLLVGENKLINDEPCSEKLPGYIFHAETNCSGDDFIGTRYVSAPADCATICDENDDCVGFVFHTGPTTYVDNCFCKNSCQDLAPAGDHITYVKGRQTFNVPAALQVPIQGGDLIGWSDANYSTDTSRLLLYVEALPGSNQYNEIRILDSECTVGGDCDWSSAKAVVRRYDLQATLDEFEAPFIDNLNATVAVAENQPAGLEIYKVIGSNNRNYNPVVQPDITYAITNGNVESFFDVDKDTGVVSTAVVLDYESTSGPVFDLEITVSQGPYSSTGTLTVTVTDVNEPHTVDNLPDVMAVDVAVCENATTIFTVKIIDDDDETSWPAMVYLLVNDNPAADLFRIDENGSILAKQDLQDWTGASVVTLFISVTDYYFTTLPLTLTVVLENIRKAPHLKELPTVVTLNEDIGAGEIFEVTAVCDTRSTMMEFNIKAVYPAHEAPPDWNPFDIETTNTNHPEYIGTIRYTGAPKFDHMSVQKYEVEIVVTDGMFQSAAENLTVEIMWVNQPPYFEELNYGISTVPELSPIGTILPYVQLRASDRDLPLGDWIDYIITGPNQAFFHASNVTHKVSVIGELRCDPGVAFVRYEIHVNVHDAAGAEGVNQPDTVIVNVIDINDHAPQFSESYYEGTVSETSPNGTEVLTIATVTDDDAGDNAKVSFVVLEDYARIYFEAARCQSSPCTKKLVLKQPISHVDYPNITFTLVAYDHGTPSLNGTTTVFVNVIDENDHPPEFVKEYYNVEGKSDVDVGSPVAQVEVYDLDTDINSNVTFVLLIPESSFGIDSDTGIVLSKTDLQAYKTHMLYVYARDFAKPVELMSDPCVVQIDTFTGKHHLVDIHMEISLEDFLTMKEDFLNRLNQRLSPWYAKQDKNLLYPYQSVLTIYALTQKPSESLDDLEETKTFIDRNSLLSALRVNIQGKPKDWLRGPQFAEYQVFKVVPTFPVWLIDTIGGIITLTLLCILFLLFWILLVCVIFRGWNKKTKVSPQVLYPDTEQYELRYGNYTHVPYPKEAPNLHHKKKKGVLPSPIVPVTATVAPKNQPSKKNVSELSEHTRATSVISNKPLPPSGQNRNIYYS